MTEKRFSMFNLGWLVALGLIMNIASALITNFSIDGATEAANQLVQQQQQNQSLIENHWLQQERVERKRELVLLLFAQERPIPEEVERILLDELSYWQDEDVPLQLSLEELESIMTILGLAQSDLRDKIDDLFLINLDLSERHRQLSLSISRQRNLSLFLQIIGLGLILARDLRPR